LPKKKKVLVTGSSGFLGSHTADALHAAGYETALYDLTPSPYAQDGQKVITGDLMDKTQLAQAMKGCDYVYHFAGIADLEEANSRPEDVSRINVMGTVQALEVARQCKVKRFVFASSAYVYSEYGGMYRASKQACENFIEEYQANFGLPYTILRYGSLYGRRAGPENGIVKMINSALNTGKITYNGHPDAIREYIHVSDAARLAVDILSDDYANQHILLTGPNRLQVADVMRMIAEIIPGQPEVHFGDEIMAGHYVTTPFQFNPKMARKLTGDSHIDLGQGLLDCIEEYYNKGK
jgi:UDP-glucose 4-epimerase